MSDVSLSELCAQYDAADDEVAKAKAAYDAAVRSRSDRCKAIATAIAPKKRIKLPQRGEVTIVIRPNKSEGYDTYFFRGSSSEAVIVAAAE